MLNDASLKYKTFRVRTDEGKPELVFTTDDIPNPIAVYSYTTAEIQQIYFATLYRQRNKFFVKIWIYDNNGEVKIQESDFDVYVWYI